MITPKQCKIGHKSISVMNDPERHNGRYFALFHRIWCLEAYTMEAWGQGVSWLHFLKWDQRILFDPTFNVYKACLFPHLTHYHAPSTPFTASITHTNSIRLCLTIPVSSATAERLFSALRTENIHQINNECKPSHTSSFATCPPRSYWQNGP